MRHLYSAPPQRSASRRKLGGIAALVVTATMVVAGCANSGSTPSDAPTASTSQSSSSSEGSMAAPATAESPAVSDSAADATSPTGWGPTVGELDGARELVAGWTPDQLAGQVIVGRWYGTDPAEASSLVADLNLAGVQLTGSNIVDEQQVRAVNQAVISAFAATGRDFPPVIGVDQEGGMVAHLYGVTTDLPAFAEAGRVVGARTGGDAVVQAAMAAAALELRDFGFTWVFAPVADVTIGAADPTIGSRSPSSDPDVAGATAAAAILGYNEAGIVSTVKHFPGHGSATEDSHHTLPVLNSSLDELRARDLKPFAVSIAAGAPAVMVGHLNVTAVAPGVPSSLAPETYDLLRNEFDFEGVAITDSLGMGGVMTWESPSVAALAAGADLLLMPADTRLAHQQVAAAITSGEVPRERAEEAAARVVALQRWQQRVGVATPIPPDAAEQAQSRVQELLSMG